MLVVWIALVWHHDILGYSVRRSRHPSPNWAPGRHPIGTFVETMIGYSVVFVSMEG